MTPPSFSPAPQPSICDRPIIFFDGECVLCNRFVDIMLYLDPQANLAIAPLQGETAKELLPPLPDNRKEWTIYYFDESGLYSRSEAFVRICQRLNNWVSILSLIALLPLPVRDGLYNIIASNRYNLFGRKPTCRMPEPDEQVHFLP